MPYRTEPLVTIATFSVPMEASLARGALEALGIRVLLLGENLGAFTRYRGTPPITELKVFESDRERASTELRRLQIRVVQSADE